MPRLDLLWSWREMLAKIASPGAWVAARKPETDLEVARRQRREPELCLTALDLQQHKVD